MDIQTRIYNRRKELGLTLKDVANVLKVSEATVSRYESSEIKNMGIDKLQGLADALHCTPAYLMGWEDEAPAFDLQMFASDDIIPAYHQLNAANKQIVDRLITDLLATQTND